MEPNDHPHPERADMIIKGVKRKDFVVMVMMILLVAGFFSPQLNARDGATAAPSRDTRVKGHIPATTAVLHVGDVLSSWSLLR